MKELIFVITCFIYSHLFGQNFLLGNEKILPGTLTHCTIKDINSQEIPVTILHGKKKGVILGIICENPENGFSPIFSSFSVFKNLNPEKISGTLIFINITNLKDIPEKIINSFDYLISISSSEKYEEILPLARFYMGEDIMLSSKSKELAINSYLPYALVVEKQFPIPALSIKLGTVGINDNENINILNNSLDKIIIFLGIKNEPLPIKGTIIIEKTEIVTSEFSGFFYSDKNAGSFVAKGELLGYILNEFGEVIKEIKAPIAGVLLQRKGISKISKNDSLFTIGVVYMY